MDIVTIDKQISDLMGKLNTKTHRMKRGKLRVIGIPEHLRIYYQQEIAKLEKEKLYLQSLKKYQITVLWENIKFEDHQIRIRVNGHFTLPFHFTRSRNSYEFLKPYILKSDLKPLLISILGNKIIQIINLDEISFIIEILSVQDEVNKYFKDFESTNIEIILSKLKGVSNQNLFSFFKLKERNIYLTYLCTIQSGYYKVIPTTEVLFSNDKIISEEETFLFTVKNDDGLFIVWESTIINKATYIFQTTESSYTVDIQRLFDFVVSGHTTKRRKLRYSIKSGVNPLKSIGVIEHKNIDIWHRKMKELVKA